MASIYGAPFPTGLEQGSYEALNGGTFAEAFGMLSGCPVQRIDLRRFKEPAAAPPTASAEERAMHARHLERWKAKGYDTDELYFKLFSYKEAGFVIGCSTFFTKEEEINEARATGIQVPHAYCLLDMKESPHGDGEQLVKLRNPNGHAGWRGEWSRASSKWTYEAKQVSAAASAAEQSGWTCPLEVPAGSARWNPHGVPTECPRSADSSATDRP